MNPVIDDRNADWFRFVMEAAHRETESSISERVLAALRNEQSPPPPKNS